MVKTRLKIISISIMLVASLSIMNGDTFAVEEMDMKQSCTGNEEKLDASRCILYKAIMEEVKHCYVDKNGSDYGTKGTVSLKDVNNKTEKSLLLSVFNKVGTYHLPTAFANTSIGSKDNKTMNCYEIANGSWMYSGIKSFKNSMVYNQKELVSLNLTDNEDKNRDDVFASLGYKKDASKSTESEYDKIIKLEYKTYTTNTENGVETSNETTYSNDVYGIKLKSNSKIESIEKIKTDQTNGELVNVKPARSYWGQKSFTIEKCSIHNNSLPSCPVSDRVLAFDYGKDENDDTYQKFLDALNSKKGKVVYTSRTENQAKDANNNPVPGSSIDVYNSTTTLHNVTETSENDNIDVTFSIKGDRTKAAHRAIYTISGEYNKLKNNLDGLKFSKVQVVGLLENYISEYYAVGDPVVPETQEEVNNYKSSGSYIATKWMTEEGTYNCAFISKEPTDHENVNVYVVSNETNLFVGTGNGFSYDKLPGRLEYRLGKNTCDNFDPETNLNTDEDARMDSDPSTLVEDQEGVDSGKNEKNTDACSQVSGLGWLLCPIIEMTASAVQSIYINTVEPLLYVQPALFSNGDDAVFPAWQTFQTISNVLLIIFLLVIIFSQLTGFGIDNYGIKKTLPRFIIAALLINTSYIICQASVDLSNILGSSLNGLFDALASTTGVYDPVSPTGTAGSVVAGTTISVAVITTVVGALVGTGAGAVLGPIAVEIGLAALPAIVMALITALIAIIFFFALLGTRQAAVVVLVAVSPLAFACYMLPNTKKIFDRWKKAMTALLLLYPIAGTLMGGGGFASAILLKAGNGEQKFWYNIVALLVQVVPFFFIPSLLKSSFSALGNIGNKISGFGQRLGRSWGGAAKRGISNASTYKNARLKAANSHAAARQGRLQSSLDKQVAAGDYKKEDGKTKAYKYAEMSAADKKKFAQNNTDFRTQDKLMKMAADKKTQDDYAKGIVAGAYSTTDQTAATEEKSWGDAAISANTNALNNETYFETDEKEFTDDYGKPLGTYKYDHRTNQWRRKLNDGSLGEALKTDKEIIDSNNQKWRTDRDGKLRKVKEDGSLGEAYKRKTFTGSDKKDYHFQDGKLVNEDGEELASGVTVTDENGIKYKKQPSGQYGAIDIEPPVDIDKDATYKYDGHDCRFENGELVYEDDNGSKVKVKKGAEVQSASGKNAGCSYKMGNKGLELTKSTDIMTKEGQKLAFYSGEKGGFKLVDISSGEEVESYTELDINGAKFSYWRSSGRLSALSTLKDDTDGFEYDGQTLRLRPDNVFETEYGGIEMKSIDPGMPATFRNDGSGEFRNIETGEKADPEQVAKAQAENKIKSYNDLRVMQSQTSDATQVGNMVGMLGANMENYTQNAVLSAQNKTINQANNTIGEGNAIHIAHERGLETTTSSLATSQNINKQFETTTGGNIAARERADAFEINQSDEDNVYTSAEAVTGKTTTQVNQAVDAAAIKNQNQFNQELAENNPAVTPVIDLEQAQFIAERKFNISEINRRHEVFSRQTRVDVEREFNDALKGVGSYAHDANAITALMHTLQEKGGHEVLMKSLKDNGTQFWRNLKSNGATDSQISEIINTFASSNNMFEKDYGKTLMKILNYGGTISDLINFDQYMKGSYATINLSGGIISAADKSMPAFIKNAGDDVIARTDKDNLQLIIDNKLEYLFTPKQMARASLHPEDYGETAIKAYDALRRFGRAEDVVNSMSNNEACEIKQNMLCALLGLPAGTNLKNLQFSPGSTQYKILNTLKGKRDKAHSVAQQNIDPTINDILDKHP